MRVMWEVNEQIVAMSENMGIPLKLNEMCKLNTAGFFIPGFKETL